MSYFEHQNGCKGAQFEAMLTSLTKRSMARGYVHLLITVYDFTLQHHVFQNKQESKNEMNLRSEWWTHPTSKLGLLSLHFVYMAISQEMIIILYQTDEKYIG